jgi:hypothetical protein
MSLSDGPEMLVRCACSREVSEKVVIESRKRFGIRIQLNDE